MAVLEVVQHGDTRLQCAETIEEACVSEIDSVGCLHQSRNTGSRYLGTQCEAGCHDNQQPEQADSELEDETFC